MRLLPSHVRLLSAAVRSGPAGGGHGGGDRHLRGKKLSAGASETGARGIPCGFPGPRHGDSGWKADRGGLRNPTGRAEPLFIRAEG